MIFLLINKNLFLLVNLVNVLEKLLREVLANIASNPKQYPPPSNVIAGEIVKEVRRRFVELALRHKDSEYLAFVLDDILSLEYRKGIVSAYYYLINELGLDKNEAIELIVEAIEVIANLKNISNLPPVYRTIINYILEIIEDEEIHSPLFLLDYASELGLIYWDGEKWNITELGRFLLKLPSLELVKALLTLEILLPGISSNSMPKEFLQLLRELFSRSNIHKIEFIINISKTQRPLVYSWLSRLANLGIFSIDYREQRIRANILTCQLLEQILDINSNPYITILQSLLSQLDPPLITVNIQSHINRIKNDPLLLNQWNEIQQAINNLDQRNYHAALRTFLPVIERILRDIIVKEGLAGTDKGLNTLVEIAKGYKLISARTEGLIKALGRDLELHGLEQLDNDRAKFYAELALMTLLELIRDYRRHKLFHRALQEIASQLDINVKELLKAYPENRKIIHVQFLSDKRLRITIKSKYVYEVYQEDNENIKIIKI